MRYKLMSIYDAAVESYSPPFCVRAVGQAIRDFQQEARDGKSRICASPKDYFLFELGEFDDAKAEFILLSAPRRIVSAQELSEL